jgi:hypothetical protein
VGAPNQLAARSTRDVLPHAVLETHALGGTRDYRPRCLLRWLASHRIRQI